MKAIEDAFTIIHIRISGIKLLRVSIRHYITGLLIVFLFFNGLRVLTSVSQFKVLEFMEAGIITIITSYISLMWIKAWPRAGRMLNRAVGYDDKDDKVEKNQSAK